MLTVKDGEAPDEEELDERMEEMDADGSGEVTWEEFVVFHLTHEAEVAMETHRTTATARPPLTTPRSTLTAPTHHRSQFLVLMYSWAAEKRG